MARVYIIGSADGLGRAAAQTLLNDGHEVVVHARNRLTAVRDLLDRGAAAVVGDLSDLEETRGLARDVNRLGRLDAVIHYAGVYTGPHVLPVNVVCSATRWTLAGCRPGWADPVPRQSAARAPHLGVACH
jgi:NAD(P)-dependent dehydrogenase (short-subunit alcohol dehydrogenase family)